jgi:hypothetical protein
MKKSFADNIRTEATWIGSPVVAIALWRDLKEKFMSRWLLQALLSSSLIGVGWSVTRAQRPEPDFEIVVAAPAGTTTVRCVRGCKLVWSERGINPNAMPTASFQFNCSGSSTTSDCVSGKIAGWLTQ